ncbi:MAG: hypothetical protein XE11_2567 [Methanomicrobiales archaeon 53_19]|nr:MAG: hypothetical protein XE11_2567 [Methanomicrobiales archaeon 53_19]
MLRLYLLILAILLISATGCVMAPGGDAPSDQMVFEAPPSPQMRISLDEALTYAEPPVYLIIGRDLLPDGMAASWIILATDPEGGFLFFFVTADGVRSSIWEGTVPGAPINPEAFPYPDRPADQVVFWEENE